MYNIWDGYILIFNGLISDIKRETDGIEDNRWKCHKTTETLSINAQ